MDIESIANDDDRDRQAVLNNIDSITRLKRSTISCGTNIVIGIWSYLNPFYGTTRHRMSAARHPSNTIGSARDILRLMHPLMPFITEEIWQNVAPRLGISGDTIMLAQWPEADHELINGEAEAEMEWLKSIIVAVRTIRSESNIPGRRVRANSWQHGCR